jgi:glycosyltransferase involved in cell wall biosynthesis
MDDKLVLLYRFEDSANSMKILLVGMADSIHLSRWLSQFDSTQIEFEVISSSPHRKVQTGITERVRNSNMVSMSKFSKYFSLPMWLFDRLFSDWIRGAYIAWRIFRSRPHIVHVHEIQNAGYATRRAYQIIKKNRPKLIVTNYGSEIVWFSKFSGHMKKIKALLELADAFSAECTRDYKLAQEITSGYVSLPLMPVAGGLTKNDKPEQPRKRIAIKGYENHWGKAVTALRAVASLGNQIEDAEIVLYSCNRPTIRAAESITRTSNLTITTYPKGALSHSEVLDLFRTSSIYIGHSLSDGISTSMLEAMAMGAIPIQTNTSCAEEWIEDQETGFLITPNDTEKIKESVLKILSGEFDSDFARETNYRVIDDRYNPNSLSRIAAGYYDKLISQ